MRGGTAAKEVVFVSFQRIRGNGIKQITQAKATLAQFVSPGPNPFDDQRNSAEANQQRPLRLIDPLGKRELLGARKQLSIVEVTEVRVERVTRARRIVDLIRDAAGGGCAIPAHRHPGFEPVRPSYLGAPESGDVGLNGGAVVLLFKLIIPHRIHLMKFSGRTRHSGRQER